MKSPQASFPLSPKEIETSEFGVQTKRHKKLEFGYSSAYPTTGNMPCGKKYVFDKQKLTHAVRKRHSLETL